jgi:MFS family permease
LPDRWEAPALPWSGVSDKRSYYKLFAGYVLALFATGVATVALALRAFDLAGDDSGAVMGTALSIKMMAYVAAAPVAAALTERLPRKQLLIALDLIRAASLGLLPFVSQVETIYALVFVFALASATFTLVYLSVVPYLLGDETDYARSLARSRIAGELDGAISPMLAGALLLVVSATGVFLIATAAFLVSAALVAAARLPRSLAAGGDGLWSKVLRGPRLFLAVPEFRGVIALDMAVALATAMVMVNTVVIIQGDLDRGADAVAFSFLAFGFGSILGAATLPSVLPRVSDRKVMLTGAALMAGALAAGTLIGSYLAVILLWALIGLGAALALTPAYYLIRRISAPGTLQTLFAAQFSISNVCLLLAYPIAGFAGASFGTPATFAILAAGTALFTGAAAWLWPPDDGGRGGTAVPHGIVPT